MPSEASNDDIISDPGEFQQRAAFFDQLYWQVGLMRVFLALFREDLRSEFAPNAPEVFFDWQRHTRSLRYLAEPAYRLLDNRWESLGDLSQEWQARLRKNLTRLVCFQNVVQDAAELFDNATSFDELAGRLDAKLRLAYAMCQLWQERIAQDGEGYSASTDRLDVLLQRIREDRQEHTWRFDQPATYSRLFEISNLEMQLEAEISLLNTENPEEYVNMDETDVATPPLSVCMASRSLFLAILHAMVTNRQMLQPGEIARFKGRFQSALTAVSRLNGQTGSLVAKSLQALRHRLDLIELIFANSTSSPTLERAAVITEVSKLTDEERLLTPDFLPFTT